MKPPRGAFGVVVTDAGRRASDAVRQAMTDGRVGLWLAIRLSDGGTDGYAYESRPEAMKWQVTETQCAYLCVPETDCPPAEATAWLALQRRAYDQGWRPSVTDAEAGRDLILPTTMQELAGLMTNGVPR